MRILMDSSLSRCSLWCTEKASGDPATDDWCREMRPRPSQTAGAPRWFRMFMLSNKNSRRAGAEHMLSNGVISTISRYQWRLQRLLDDVMGERNGGVERAWSSSCHGGSRRRWRTGHAGVRLVDRVPGRQLGQHQLLSELMRRWNMQPVCQGKPRLKPSREKQKLAKVDQNSKGRQTCF